MRASMVVFPLVCLALAGCAEGPDAERSGQQRDPPPGTATAPLPTWELGQYWSYVDSFGGGYTLVVVEDAGEEWVTWTDSLPVAYYDFAFDISFVGDMRKADLAGRQDDERIEFFRFPLSDGKDWTTVWDGQERHVVVEANDDGTYAVTAHLAQNEVGDQHASYTYDPEIGFVTDMTFYDPATGEVSYAIELQDAGTGFTGETVRYTQVQNATSGTIEGAGQSFQATFPVAEESEVAITASYDCGSGSGQLLAAVDDPEEGNASGVLPPAPFVNEPRYGFILACPGAGNATEQAVVPAKPGTWRADAMVANQDGRIDLLVQLRTYETRSL